ncbi:ArsR/SmtB family transcription factor [Leeia oryzae]|uniref:ArsR/SmtB family transcription factor n=1 Tax=Leeia oryzae TaxID=356662 RepID=UPI000377EEC4|nr:metalloregulator ArsR/SmtB family transcription factor [Leeia oryzae]
MECAPDLPALKHAANEAVALLKTLGNPDRLLLLCQMAAQECSVSELEELLDIHQPTLSQQLGILRRAGLVSTRKEGKQIFYRLSSDKATEVIATLYGLYCQPPGPTP